MFSGVKRHDLVLVLVDWDRSTIFENVKSFLISMPVGGTTPTRFTVNGITYKKTDGYSYPHGYGYCYPYEESKDETSELKGYNDEAVTISDIDNYLYSFGKLRVNRKTKNLHTILKQAEILAALIKAGSE